MAIAERRSPPNPFCARHGETGFLLRRGRPLTVLTDVTDDSELVEVSTSSLGPERLLESDLNVADKVPVQDDCSERRVGGERDLPN
jgi:hypothetical protein